MKNICISIALVSILSGCLKEAIYNKKAKKAKERIEDYILKTDSTKSFDTLENSKAK